MSLDVTGMIEGIKNKFLPKKEIEALIEDTYKKRMEICNKCEFKKTIIGGIEICGDCGCTLSLKNRCLRCKCPQGKWGAIATEEEENTIKQYYESQKNSD